MVLRNVTSPEQVDNRWKGSILIMPPLPLPDRPSPTPAGFLAALRCSESESSTTSNWQAPSAGTHSRALELLSTIQRQQGSTLAAWVQQRRRAKKTNEVMYMTIRRLSAHALSLADQVGLYMSSMAIADAPDKGSPIRHHRQAISRRGLGRSGRSSRSHTPRSTFRAVR